MKVSLAADGQYKITICSLLRKRCFMVLLSTKICYICCILWPYMRKPQSKFDPLPLIANEKKNLFGVWFLFVSVMAIKNQFVFFMELFCLWRHKAYTYMRKIRLSWQNIDIFIVLNRFKSSFIHKNSDLVKF